MKIAILVLIIFLVFYIFRLLRIKSQSSNKQHETDKEKIIDLEKDPKTDEYKPKE